MLHDIPNTQNDPQVSGAWRLQYMRQNARMHVLICIGALVASFLVVVPKPPFLIASAALGLFVFFTWTTPSVRSKLIWLVPLAVGGSAWLAVAFSDTQSNTIGFLQFLCTALGVKSLCFWLEGAFFSSRIQKSDQA